jgi:hypothetical protein
MNAATIILAAALTLLTVARAADFEYGGRPPGSVFDPQNVLDPATRAEISMPLERILRDEGVEVVVVILPSLDGAPPEFVAGRFANAWCQSPIHAVVLHIPGEKQAPWIVPEGKLVGSIKPEVVSQKVAEATRNAAREPTESAKVRAAATEAADMLRYWMRNAINRSEFLETERTKIRLELEAKARQRQITLLAAAASAVPLLIGVFLLFNALRKRGPGLFPDHRPPRRLGAPHCGGNHCVVSLGPLPSSKP